MIARHHRWIRSTREAARSAVPFDPSWSVAFAHEADALSGVFGTRALAIEHVGSTAVDGLAAKPIIDVLVIVDHTDDLSVFSAGMEALGYTVRGECLAAAFPGTPGRFYYSKAIGEQRTHHVHVCALGHPQIPELLALRNYLRAHPAEAAHYAAVKARAAQTGPSGRSEAQ